MPLITGKSKESFSQNVKTEMNAGKPQKQSVAIAYAKKREAEKRNKKWRGGDIEKYDEGGKITLDPDLVKKFKSGFNKGGQVGRMKK